MKLSTFSLIVLVICLSGLAGCQSNGSVSGRPSAVIGTRAPAVPPSAVSPTPAKCTQHPGGLSIQITPGGKYNTIQNIRLDGQGFIAGEKLYVAIETVGTRRLQRLEVFDLSVKPDGTFSDSESLQLDESSMQWQVFVVHQRGTACASFTTH